MTKTEEINLWLEMLKDSEVTFNSNVKYENRRLKQIKKVIGKWKLERKPKKK